MKVKRYYLVLVLLVFGITSVLAQEKTVSGTISDNEGLSLPGATILIKGTTVGASSDFDGNYSIKANQGDVLVFSFVGYISQEISIANSNTINVTLLEDRTSLEEVVVTAFGIKRNPKSLGYAVSSVESKEVIENSEPDLIRSLSGKVAGVNVNFSNGVAGASNQINIRGATTIGGASQPLIIVDGVAYSNSQTTTVELQPPSGFSTGGGGYESGLSTLDPNDIASVNVLKSTAAAALYGSRATNGVIVITTKSGASSNNVNKNNKLSVSVSSGTYFEEIANLPDYQNKYGQGTQFSFNAGSNGSWGPAFDTLETIPVWNSWVTAFPDVYGPGLIETLPYVAQPNNVKDLFQTGIVLDNSVTASSSNENGNFSVTLSDMEQKGYMPFNTYDRTSFSAGGNFKLPNNITVGGSVSYSDTKQVGGFFGNQQFAGSSSSFARSLWLGRTWDLSIPFTNPITGGSVIPNTGWDHPLWSWKNDQIITNSNRIVTNLNIGVPINDHISASFRVGYNKYNLSRSEIRHPLSIASALTGGTLIKDASIIEDLESTLLFNFDYNLTDAIGFSAITGLNTYQRDSKRDANLGTTFISPNIYTLANTITVSNLADSFTRKRNVGVFADLTLSYKDFLFLNGTGRNDWSSTLPIDNRSYFYPSASLSLIVTEALKLESNVLTFAKLRGGWASVGNDASAEFLNTTFATGIPFASIPVLGNRIALGDQEITPEFTDEIEIGADLEFFKRRIAIDFTWYKKTTTDLISPVSVPRSSGFTSFNTNIGEMTNTGIEIGLTLVPIQTENFKWNLFTTFTKNTNEVTELVEGLERLRLDGNQVAYAIVGQPFGVFFGSKHQRDDEGNYIIDQSTGWIFEDPTSDIIGDPTPDFKMGIINTFTYKNVSLRAQFDWREGGDIQSISIGSLLGRGVTKDTEDRERTHIIPGFYGDVNGNYTLDGTGNRIPNTTQIDTNDLYFTGGGPSNTWGINSTDQGTVYDGTVYRLRELSLSYDVPSKWLEKTPFGKVSLSAFGNNLWYFAPNVPRYTNYDPEVTSFGSGRVQGIENSSAPTSKRYGFKINLTF